MSTTHESAAKADRLIPFTVDLPVTAVACREADGRFSVAIPSLPGCVSYGATLEEARAMIREAAEGWLVAMHEKHLPEVAEDFTGGLPLKPVSGKRLCRVLEEHGWFHSHTRGSHHHYKRDGSPLTLAVPVHRNEDLPTGTQKSIMRQAGLTDADL